MVSSSLLLGLTTVAGLVHGFPLRSANDLMHGASNFLDSRSPEPRFRNPFNVAAFLKEVDTKIPDNKDIQHWIDQAEQKGAMGGDDEDDSDSDNDDIDDKKDDHDDDDDENDHREEEHTSHPNIENMTRSSPSASSPRSTVFETSRAVASSRPSPSSNAEGQVTTVYVPVPVFPSWVPSLDRDETLTSAPTVSPSPSTTPMSATPTSTPVLYKIRGAMLITTEDGAGSFTPGHVEIVKLSSGHGQTEEEDENRSSEAGLSEPESRYPWMTPEHTGFGRNLM